MSGNGISVVVPTYNCKDLLILTLESLCNQGLARYLFEVLVVDDGSSDGTRDIIPSYNDRINIRYYFQEDLGFRVAAARNVGIEHANFDIVLFIDSGIVVSSRLLKLHYEEHLGDPALVLMGMSYGVLEYENPASCLLGALMGGSVDHALVVLCGHDDLRDCRANYIESIDFDVSKMSCPWLILWGGHVSVSKAQLQLVGGFDEKFRCWGGEDVELGLRLYQNGGRFRMLRGMESIHYPHFKDPNKKMMDSRKNVLYMHMKHNIRETRLLMSMGWEAVIRKMEVSLTQSSVRAKAD